MTAAIAFLGAAALGVLLCIVQALVGAEAVGQVPRHCEGVIERQVRRLPQDERGFTREVWLGELAACADRPLTALWWTHVVVRRGCTAQLCEMRREKAKGEGMPYPSRRMGQAIYRFIDHGLALWEVRMQVEYANAGWERPWMTKVYGRVDIADVLRHPALREDVRQEMRERRIDELREQLQSASPSARLSIEAEIGQIERVLRAARPTEKQPFHG